MSGTNTFSLKRFLGLNEVRDGDTQLRMGEAAQMDNWRVTPQYHLRVRPGLKTVWSFSSPIRGLWYGTLAGKEWMVCAEAGGIWALDLADGSKRRIAQLGKGPVTFFGFGNKLYMLGGSDYYRWDGGEYAWAVPGYVPLIATAVPPSGGGTLLEPINRLSEQRRIQFSGDGVSTDYYLPEQDLNTIYTIHVDGVLNGCSPAQDNAKGMIHFKTPPPKGVNNVEVRYGIPPSRSIRKQVGKMRFAETYNGATDTRIFLYGDGTNRAIYSGITQAGVPSAEYFPDLNEIAVDSENTPITGMIKQFSYLMIFKPDGAFSTQYASMTLQDGTVTAGFCVLPVNREIGNEAPGQVRSVYNDPRTLYAGNVYDWQMTTAGRDERRARLMSERVSETLRRADMSKVCCFDNERDQEYYIFLNDEAGTALVHRYRYAEGDVWYRYRGLPVTAAIRAGDEIYFGLSDGRLCRFSEDYRSDDGARIPCRWESGHMDFGADCRRKRSGLLWVSLKPDSNARLTVTAQTDRRTAYTVRTAVSSLAAFAGADFRRWSFRTNRSPQIERLKLKVRRFAFYKLMLTCDESSATTTVLGVDMQVRYTGNVK